VPLELFDQVLKAKEDKQEYKKNLISNLITKLKNDAVAKIKATGIETEKTKKIVENSVFITSLNQYLDTEHTKIFSWYYKNQILYLQFIVT
jgi:cellulase/cellobiase CelA1